MDLTCPTCGSQNTQKVSAIVSEGTHYSYSTNSATLVGTVGGRAGIATTTSSTTSVSTTELAERLAPPKLRRYHNPINLTVLAGFVAFGAFWIAAQFTHTLRLKYPEELWVLGPATLLGFVFGFYFFDKSGDESRKWNVEVYPKLYAKWNRKFYCHRCESIFLAANSVNDNNSFEKLAQQSIKDINERFGKLSEAVLQKKQK